jgi:hypothetical protein
LHVKEYFPSICSPAINLWNRNHITKGSSNEPETLNLCNGNVRSELDKKIEMLHDYGKGPVGSPRG